VSNPRSIVNIARGPGVVYAVSILKTCRKKVAKRYSSRRESTVICLFVTFTVYVRVEPAAARARLGGWIERVVGAVA
jgi:hypothetical protein